MTLELFGAIEMQIHEVLALVPPDARKLYESLRAERRAGNTTNTFEGLLKKYDGDIHAVLQALDTHVPITLISANWETNSSNNEARVTTELHVTMPLSSKMMVPFECIVALEKRMTATINLADITKIAELLLDKSVLNRNELADLHGCLAIWSNIIGKAVATLASPDQSWSLEKAKRMSENELAVCQKIFALISYLCDKANTP